MSSTTKTTKDKGGSWVDYLHAIGWYSEYYLGCFYVRPDQIETENMASEHFPLYSEVKVNGLRKS